jgi:3-oxoacyl-[acyl-carrier protein] reductase
MEGFLRSTEVIDWHHPEVLAQARELSTGDPLTTAKRCFTTETFDRQFMVNTRAPALLMAEFTKRHIRRGSSWGRVINISTDAAECFPSQVSYGAAKLALESYTRSAAAELGPFGITANVLALGPVQTGWITPEHERALIPTIPLRRIG